MVRPHFIGPTPFDEKRNNFYYDKMIRNAMQNFVKMVWSNELIEHGIKNKKIKRKATHVLQRRPPQLKEKRETLMLFSPINC